MSKQSNRLGLTGAVIGALTAAALYLNVVPALATPAATTTSITLTPSATVTQGDSASAVGQTCSGSPTCTPVTIGKLELQVAADATGNPTSCELQTQFLSGTPTDVDSNGSATFSLGTSTVGIFGYRMHYTQGSTYGTSFSPCADLTVQAQQSCTGVTIAADLASGNGTPAPGGSYTWTVRIKVHACDDATDLKAQGGTNGWANNTLSNLYSGNPTLGVVNVTQHPKNQVITWTMPSLAGGTDATLIITVTGTIKPNTPLGTVLGLTGPWSVTYSTDGGQTYQKSDYTGEVTVTVTAP